MKRILVIDDEEGIRDSFRLALHDSPYSVETAADGSAGIEAARARRPDLVILDLRMPGIDGVETLRRLLADDSTLRICIHTAFYAEYFRPLKDAADAGLVFEVVRKPLDAKEIRSVVNGWLGDCDNTGTTLPQGA